MTPDEEDDLANRFRYHKPPTEHDARRHEVIRQSVLECALDLAQQIEEGVGPTNGRRERALAMTKLEEAMFWANAALARNWPRESDSSDV